MHGSTSKEGERTAVGEIRTSTFQKATQVKSECEERAQIHFLLSSGSPVLCILGADVLQVQSSWWKFEKK